MDDSLIRRLYRLPPELFIRVLDFFDFNGILYLCNDPDFPMHLLHRRHLEPDEKGYSILHAAAEIRWVRIPVVKEFIRILGEWDTQDQNGRTPLAVATEASEYWPSGSKYERRRAKDQLSQATYQLCQAFLEAGAQVDGAATLNEKPLPLWNAAVIRGNRDIVSLLLEYGANISWKNEDEHIIHHAAGRGDRQVVELLLDSGADPNANGESCTPLHWVRDPEIAKLLLERGADLNNICEDNINCAGMTPLMSAVDESNSELVQTLLDAGAEPDKCRWRECALIMAINVWRSSDIVQLLIDAGCDVDQLDPDDVPALHLAVERSSEDVVRMLLAAGADTFQKNPNGESILCKAVECCEVEIVQMLLDDDCDPCDADDNGVQPVLLAAAGSKEIVYRVMQDGGFRSDFGKYEESPFSWSSEKLERNVSVLRKLLRDGADISETTYKGYGILHFAAWRGNKKIIRILLNAGANPLYADPHGKTPADLAAEIVGYEGIERILRKAEAARRDAMEQRVVEQSEP